MLCLLGLENKSFEGFFYHIWAFFDHVTQFEGFFFYHIWAFFGHVTQFEGFLYHIWAFFGHVTQFEGVFFTIYGPFWSCNPDTPI